MRISDWSSDVCSSDLQAQAEQVTCFPIFRVGVDALLQCVCRRGGRGGAGQFQFAAQALGARVGGEVGGQGVEFGTGSIGDRKNGVAGKRVSVRVDLGGRRLITKTTKTKRDETT